MPGPGHWGSVARGSGDGAVIPGGTVAPAATSARADDGTVEHRGTVAHQGFGTDDRAMNHAQVADGRALAHQ